MKLRVAQLSACLCLALAALMSGCQTPASKNEQAETSVRAALDQQVREWNAGNLAGFMETYAKSERTRFASGGDLSLGWQTVFDRYQKKYGTRAAMGTLRFSDLEITPIGRDAALAFGRWHLKREADAPSGLFTLIFRQTDEGWRIVHDHTSSAATP
jgi:ketosteroid isomerase-like protein